MKKNDPNAPDQKSPLFPEGLLGLVLGLQVLTILLALAGSSYTANGFKFDPFEQRQSWVPLLQYICFVLYAYLAFTAGRKGNWGWVWMFGALAVAFNPFPCFVVKMIYSPYIWLCVSVAAILVAIKAFFAFPSESK